MKFSQIDGYVHARLAILASAKHGLKGRNSLASTTEGSLPPTRQTEREMIRVT